MQVTGDLDVLRAMYPFYIKSLPIIEQRSC